MSQSHKPSKLAYPSGILPCSSDIHYKTINFNIGWENAQENLQQENISIPLGKMKNISNFEGFWTFIRKS